METKTRLQKTKADVEFAVQYGLLVVQETVKKLWKNKWYGFALVGAGTALVLRRK